MANIVVFEAFGEAKSIMEWLNDVRINPEVTRDVLVKRIKRGTMPEKALTTPVIKGAGKGDTKKRVKDREKKFMHRLKMFLLAQKVRRQYEKGIAVEELMDRFSLSKSQVTKISQKLEWYSVHWAVYGKYPEEYIAAIDQLKKEDTSLKDEEETDGGVWKEE